MGWYVAVLKKYAVFKGRARRKEYWMFFLFNVIIAFALGFIEGLMGMNKAGATNIFGTIYQLAVLLPSIAVGVRRMHDINRTGWWILCPIVNLVFACWGTVPGENKYGPDPKASAA